MLRASVLIILIAFALASFPPGASTPAGECVAGGPFDRWIPAPAFPELPGVSIGLGERDTRLPPVPTVTALTEEGVCDLTHGLGAFLEGRLAIAGADAAIAVARLSAQTAYPDVFGIPIVLPDARLDVRAAPPRVEPSGKGHLVTLLTWSERNGYVAQWRILVEGLRATPRFEILAGAVGPHEPATDGWILLPGDTEERLLPPSPLALKTLVGANGDGTTWRVRYYTTLFASEAEADFYAAMALASARNAYAQETSWGFKSKDPDKILEISLIGCNCIVGEADAKIYMSPRPGDLLRLLPQLSYPSEEAFSLIVTGHELFHHFQYGLNQWHLGPWISEGTARFSETVFATDVAHAPKTIQYLPNVNGFSNVMLAPANSLKLRSYDFGLFWGFLYANNGGIAVIRHVLEEVAKVGTDVDTEGPKAVTAALLRIEASKRKHDTFEEALIDFASKFPARSFVWGDAQGRNLKDWGAYLPPAAVAKTVPKGIGSASGGLFVGSIELARLVGAKSAAVTVQTSPSVRAALVTQQGADWKVADAIPAAAAADFATGYVALARGDGPGVLGVNVQHPTGVPRVDPPGNGNYVIRGVLV